MADTEVLAPDEKNPLVPISLEALDMIERSRIDLQISAAKRHPRAPIEVIEERIRQRAARRPDIAELCYYSLPRKDKEEKKSILIHGPSIKLARIALSCWGNTLAGAWTVGNDGRVIKAHGICWDLETNNQQFNEVQRRIIDKNGNPYSYDLKIQTAMAANSIAKRNAILDVLGDDIHHPVLAACMQVVKDAKQLMGEEAKNLAEKRDVAMKWFARRGIRYEQLLQLLDKESIEQLDADDVVYLSGVANGVRDKVITVQEAFDLAEDDEPLGPTPKQKLGAKLAQRRAEKRAAAETQAKQPEEK